MCNSIRDENPYTMIIAGDFNGHCKQWWPEGDSNAEGIAIDSLTSNLGLCQLITEPTNIQDNSMASCIDLFFCDQPNLVIESGIKPSLDLCCKHQITFGKLNYLIPPAPTFRRKVWDNKKSNVFLLQRAIREYPWDDMLNSNPDPNWQIAFFNSTFLNIMSNFIPNKFVKIDSKDPPWIIPNLKNMIKRQQRIYKNFKRHGFNENDKTRVDSFREDCNMAIHEAKNKHMRNLGDKLNDPNTSQKTYWYIINKLLNKHNAPPLLIDNRFVLKAKEKATEFNKFFANQCKPLINGSTLPPFNYLTVSK